MKQIKVSSRRRKECKELNDDRNVLQKVNVSLDVACWRASSTNKCVRETSCSKMALGFISNGGGGGGGGSEEVVVGVEDELEMNQLIVVKEINERKDFHWSMSTF